MSRTDGPLGYLVPALMAANYYGGLVLTSAEVYSSRAVTRHITVCM